MKIHKKVTQNVNEIELCVPVCYSSSEAIPDRAYLPMTKHWKYVTCKRCLQAKKKHELEQKGGNDEDNLCVQPE